MKRLIGTHNSYHKKPFICLHPSWNYTHPPLYNQLAQGIRQFELDLHWAVFGHYVKVQHVPWVDCRSNYKSIEDAFNDVVRYVDKFGIEDMILILLEPKGDEKKGSEKVLPAAERAALDILGDRMVTAKQFRDNQWTWELMSTSRKIFVGIIDDGVERKSYIENGNDIFFVEREFYCSHDDPIKNKEVIEADVAAGKLIRTRGDEGLKWNPERLRAALESGAQVISTDFPEQTRKAILEFDKAL